MFVVLKSGSGHMLKTNIVCVIIPKQLSTLTKSSACMLALF